MPKCPACRTIMLKLPFLPPPKGKCGYLGEFESEGELRIVCDSTGDDVSPEFCLYCQYYAKTYEVSRFEFSEKFALHLMKIFDELKEAKE